MLLHISIYLNNFLMKNLNDLQHISPNLYFSKENMTLDLLFQRLLLLTLGPLHPASVCRRSASGPPSQRL